jgi:hypothetical protein
MPSKDEFHEQNPTTNQWLGANAPSSQKAKTTRGSSRGSSATRAASTTKQAAHVQKLAATLGVDAEELAARIPEDTLRRLKYPVLEQTDPESGLTVFEHDRGVMRDRQSLLAADRAHEAIPKGSGGRGAGVSQPRAASGKFTK